MGRPDEGEYDVDLDDAVMLSRSDAMGGSLWHPQRLDDFLDLPFRVLPLYDAIRAGIGAAAEPWRWWCKGDNRVARKAHQYEATLSGKPDKAARCGYDPATDPSAIGFDWYPWAPGQPRCSPCEALDSGRLAAEVTP